MLSVLVAVCVIFRTSPSPHKRKLCTLKGVNAIIFDFDGTIADSFDQVLQFLLSKTGRDVKNLTDEERDSLRGLSMKDLALKIGVPWWRLPLTYFQGKSALTRHMHKTPPFDGLKVVIANLHAEGYQLYIISSNSKRNINRFLSQQGLGDYFVRVYGNAGWFGKGGILRKAVKTNHLHSQQTVYVGDEVRDVVGAHMANMPVVAVNWGFCSEEQLLAVKPTVLVRSPAELQKSLVDWGSLS